MESYPNRTLKQTDEIGHNQCWLQASKELCNLTYTRPAADALIYGYAAVARFKIVCVLLFVHFISLLLLLWLLWCGCESVWWFCRLIETQNERQSFSFHSFSMCLVCSIVCNASILLYCCRLWAVSSDASSLFSSLFLSVLFPHLHTKSHALFARCARIAIDRFASPHSY